MVFDLGKHISDAHKGYILMISGILLLLHTLGLIVTGINFILIAASIYMILYGFFKADCQRKLQTLFRRSQRNDEN